MAVDFRINSLGGMSPGAAVQRGAGLYQQGRNNALQDEDRAIQQQQMQQQQAQQERTKQLMQGASGGDADALEALWAENPNIANMYTQRDQERLQNQGAEAAKLSQQKEVDFAVQFKKANPEQRQALLQQAAVDDMIDIDESDLALNEEQLDLAVNTMLFQNLGKDGYKALVSDAEPEAMTAYQRATTNLRSAELDLNRLKERRAVAKSKEESKKLDTEIKVKEAKLKKDIKESEMATLNSVSDSESSLSQAEDTVKLIDRITSSDGFSDAVGAKGVSSLFGIIDNPLPGTDAADTAALITTLESQNFLNSIKQMTGMGSLSDAEGKKISAAVQNLNLNQSESQMRENLGVVTEITKRGIDKHKEKIKNLKYQQEKNHPKNEAPQAALDYLKNNPNQREAFKAKYGYLPEGG